MRSVFTDFPALWAALGMTPAGVDTMSATIGGRPSSSGGRYRGLLDEVAFYNRALTPAEVTALYVGLGQAFYVNGTGEAAGQGTASAEGSSLASLKARCADRQAVLSLGLRVTTRCNAASGCRSPWLWARYWPLRWGWGSCMDC